MAIDLSLAGAGNNTGFLAQPIQQDFMRAPNVNAPSLSLAAGNMPLGSQDNLSLDMGNANAGGFDWGNMMSNFGAGAQGLAGLAGAYTAYKQLGLMEDQLGMQKGIANRNIANQAATTNRQLDDRASMAAQMTSGAEYGTEAHKKAKANLQTTVDGSPIA